MTNPVTNPATTPFDADPILVEVLRSGFVESVHRGRVAVTAPDGTLSASLGDAFAPMYPRSSSKPLQAVGMLRAGLDLPSEQVAVTCASHSGEEFHQHAVQQILVSVGLDELALQTPPDWPLDDECRLALIRAGGRPSPLAMNCSGKHAGMIATSVINRWPTETYRDPQHPTQLAILRALDDLTGEQAINLAVDGCGAPLYAVSLAGLARAYGRLAVATAGPESLVRTAILEHPEYVSGTRRDELALHRAIARRGGEGWRRGRLRGRSARRPGRGAQDQRRLSARPGGGHGRSAATARPRPSDLDRAGECGGVRSR